MQRLYKISPKTLVIIISIFMLIGVVGLIIWLDNDYYQGEIAGLASINRSVNAYFMALITAMALIITLTSNLYSPRLVRIFVAHPLTVIGVAYLLVTNLVITITHLLEKTHPWYETVTFASYTLSIVGMLGMIPFLYLFSQFVRPSYFIPLMRKYAENSLNSMHKQNQSKNQVAKDCANFFESIDVINNMASTAIQRKDRVVLFLVLDEIFKILKLLIQYQSHEELNQTWRRKTYFFTPGMSEEGKYYLKKYKTWPEAYLLAKILENTNVLGKTDNEIVPFVCREITKCNDMANGLKNDHLIELHLMVLNSILKESLEDYNQNKFSITTYYYRLNIELLVANTKMCDTALDHFLYYGELALAKDEYVAAKSFLFDLGRVTNYISFEGEKMSCNFYNKLLKGIWNRYIECGGQYEEIVYQSIVKTFWTLYSQNYFTLTNLIQRDYLKSNMHHARILTKLLSFSNPLSREYNDTLVCTEFMSGMARNLAIDFLSEFNQGNDLDKNPLS